MRLTKRENNDIIKAIQIFKSQVNMANKEINEIEALKKEVAGCRVLLETITEILFFNQYHKVQNNIIAKK